jgi:hypothetical protein
MSDKPLAERLQVKNGRRLAVIGAPPEAEAVIGAPDVRAPVSEAEVALLFAPSRAELATALPALLAELRSDAILWMAYPKLTSRLAGDLNRDVVRDAAPAFGLDTVSQIAIDADWSALRLKRVR